MNAAYPKLDEFVGFIAERWDVHLLRKNNVPQPWTSDPILQKYRFTNVRREDDRVTKWVHAHWLDPYKEHEDVWFAMYVARVFNKPDTLEAVGFPLPWSAARRASALRRLTLMQQAKKKVFNGAYIVSTNAQPVPKVEFYLRIFDTLWSRRRELRPTRADTLETFYQRLCAQDGLGGFMTSQVVADLKWIMPLRKAKDWSTFAHSGPGSRRGLNWVCGYEPNAHWTERVWMEELQALRKLANPMLDQRGVKPLDAQNLQNCLCEFSKYCKVKYGGGRAKQLFRPSSMPYK